MIVWNCGNLWIYSAKCLHVLVGFGLLVSRVTHELVCDLELWKSMDLFRLGLGLNLLRFDTFPFSGNARSCQIYSLGWRRSNLLNRGPHLNFTDLSYSVQFFELFV